MICPICNNKSINQQICETCGWKFKFYTDEISDIKKEKLSKEIDDAREEYLKSILGNKHNYPEFKREILEKNEFTTTEEHRKEIKKLGYLKIGIIKYINYDADTENLVIKILLSEEFKKIDVIQDFTEEEFAINMKRDIAKIVFSEKKEYDLLAQIDYINKKVEILDLKFLNYNLMKILDPDYVAKALEIAGIVIEEAVIGVGVLAVGLYEGGTMIIRKLFK